MFVYWHAQYSASTFDADVCGWGSVKVVDINACVTGTPPLFQASEPTAHDGVYSSCSTG